MRVYPFTTTESTNYNLTLSATASVDLDWYTQNLRDAGLISLSRSLASDGNISRNDIISLLRDAKDGAWTTELETARVHVRWDLVVDGAKLTGTMTMIPSQAIVRRMELRREE